VGTNTGGNVSAGGTTAAGGSNMAGVTGAVGTSGGSQAMGGNTAVGGSSNTAAECPDGWTGSGCQTCVVYVDGTHGNNANPGNTWGNAKADIQAGIDAAFADAGHCNVWIARGTYSPTYKPDPLGSATTCARALNSIGTYPLQISFCDIQGSGFDGTNGNIDQDPQFYSITAGSMDLHLKEGSACRDAGSNPEVAPDSLDLNGNSNFAEPTPIDVAGATRVQNGHVDIGAYEGPSLSAVLP
jgi:hypothetical protein